MLNGTLLPPQNLQEPFIPWFEKCLLSPNFPLFAATLWWCWKWRNSLIFTDEIWPVDVVLKHVYEDLRSWRLWMAASQQPVQTAAAASIPCVLLAVDGSWVVGLGRMGCGGFIRDSSRGWISGFSISFGHGNSFLAEMLAIEEGLKLTWELGYRRVSCVTDCKEAVAIFMDNRDTSTYWASDTIHRIKGMLTWSWEVSFKHISRQHNMVADSLACKASRDGTPFRVWRSPPSYVVPLLCQDALL